MSLVFFDIDGTLIDQKHNLPASAVKAIRQLRRNGHQAFVNTGRSISVIQDEVFDIGFDGIVASCGSSIHMGEKTLLEKTISPLLMYNMLKLFEQQKIDIWLEGPEYIYVSDVNAGGFMANIINYLRQGRDNIRSWHNTSLVVNKFSYHCNHIEQLKPLQPMLNDNFDTIRHTDLVGEVILKGYDKATGIDFIVNHLNLADSESVTYAFGDSPNDLTMLERADHGIAMGDGNPKALAASEYITTAPERDGIYLALKHYKLI
jgi:Cof subfamily protein (haloacid dehalogenase superfamily)